MLPPAGWSLLFGRRLLGVARPADGDDNVHQEVAMMNMKESEEMSNTATRREMLGQSLALASAGWMLAAPHDTRAAVGPPPQRPASLHYCLNTSTIRGHQLPLDREIELVADAGYDGIEPWIREIRQYAEGGGNLVDLRKRLEDRGLTVDSAIGFANWIVDDEGARSKGLEALKSDMDLIRRLGGTKIAAPPAGATQQDNLDLRQAAERYAAALELGEEMGVEPQLELWGFSKTLSRLGELMFVAIESGHEDAGVLLDVYHIYKGGSDFNGLRLIDGSAVKVLHMNDYPDIHRNKIGDGDRVYPGDGVAPLSNILQTLLDNGFSGTLSLELFNREYWNAEVSDVLSRGLASMKKAVGAALATEPSR